MDNKKIYKNPSPEINANFLSKLFFCWMIPFVKHNYGKNVQMKDIYSTTDKNLSENVGDLLERNWNREVKDAEKKGRVPSLLKVVIKTFGFSYITAGLLLAVQLIILRCAQPYVVYEFIGHFHNVNDKPENGWIYGIALIVVVVLLTFFFHEYYANCQALGLRVKVACCSLIYRKILKLSHTSLSQTTPGQIVNLLSNDVQRIETAASYFHYIYIIPLHILVMCYVTYQTVGIAFLPGLIYILIEGFPVEGCLSRIQGKLRSQIALATGKRLAIMNDIISGIQVIKMYAWEKSLEAIAMASRKLEMTFISKSCYIKGFNVAMMTFTERISLFLMITTHLLLGNHLSGSMVFSLTFMVGIMQGSLCYYLPLSFDSIAEVKVSMGRLQEFLLLDEKADSVLSANGILVNRNTSSIKLQNVRAGWLPSNQTLNDICLNIKQGTLCCVVGKVGAGKSSLLHLLLKELPASSGTVDITGKISYASQEPWLFVASVRNNILFGQQYLQNKYQEVVTVCALVKDFRQFPHRDQTIIGEKGVSLSGGQRARINLARAVYQDADIYLLDDPLSAVDTHVANHLFEECILKYLQNKTRILVTHQIQFLKQADLIVVLEEGKISKIMENDEVCESNLTQLDEVLDVNETEDRGEEENSIKSKRIKRTMSTRSKSSSFEYDVEQDENEEMTSKDVTFSSFIKYISSGTNIFVLIFISIFFVISQLVVNITELFVAYWTDQEENKSLTFNFDINQNDIHVLTHNESSITFPKTIHRTNMSIYYYETHVKEDSVNNVNYYIYLGLIISCVIVTTLRPLLFCKICINASKALHDRMLSNIMSSAMRFFHSNSSGRILNRFSKDIGSVDEALPAALLWVLNTGLVLIGYVIVLCIVSPWMILPLILVVVGEYCIVKLFLSTMLRIAKLEANDRSPIFSHITATYYGLQTIRSVEAELMVQKYFDTLQDNHTSTRYMTIIYGRMFCSYMEHICNLILVAATLQYIIISKENTSGEIGLAISVASGFSLVVQYCVSFTTEAISNMVCVERILQYMNIDEESALEFDNRNEITENWPHSGKITFINVFLRYEINEPSVLKNLNFCVKAGEKIGIVGRTGAGKSSLITCLFRLSQIEGTITIDDIDAASVDLKTLRSSISIIPQEPVLFSASLRYNLDPLGKVTDQTLWRVLENVELKGAVKSLDEEVSNGGANFSVGQKQLICLARAIVKNNRILIMDEATANVDTTTDALIQNTIRKHFSKCTVLTIAHRLNTIMDSDRILVMNLGQVVEFAHAHELLQNPNGYFSSMVKETGKVVQETLRMIAKENFEKKFINES